MKFTLENAETFQVLPDDVVVQVIVDHIELRDVPGRDGNEGWQKLNFRFKILELPSTLEEEYASLIGATVFGSVAARFTTHPDNKLRQWAQALLGFDLGEPGFDLDTQMLFGRKARAVIGSYQKKGSTVRNNQVVALLPLAPALSAVPTATAFNDDPPF